MLYSLHCTDIWRNYFRTLTKPINMIILNEPTVTLEYDPGKKQILQRWYGMCSSEIFRNAIDKTIEFSKSNKVNAIISNTLEQSVVKPVDVEYASSSMPKLFSAGVKAMAFVIPRNAITQMSLNKFDKDTKTEMIRFFESVSEAQRWIDKTAN